MVVNGGVDGWTDCFFLLFSGSCCFLVLVVLVVFFWDRHARFVVPLLCQTLLPRCWASHACRPFQWP